MADPIAPGRVSEHVPAHMLERKDVVVMSEQARQVKTVGMGLKVRVWFTDGTVSIFGRGDVVERWADR